jgi:hypothetical protein
MQYDLLVSQRQNALGIYAGYNMYPGTTYEILGQKFRGPLLSGLNIGLEYRRHVFGQLLFLNTKYIHGDGYRDLIGSVGARWKLWSGKKR